MRTTGLVITAAVCLGLGSCSSAGYMLEGSRQALVFQEVVKLPEGFFFFSGTEGMEFGDRVEIYPEEFWKVKHDHTLHLGARYSQTTADSINHFFSQHIGQPILVSLQGRAIFYFEVEASSRVLAGPNLIDVQSFLTEDWLDGLLEASE